MRAVLTKPVDSARLAAALRLFTDAGPPPLLDVAEDNPALLAGVRDAFARQTPELLGAIRQAIAGNDSLGVARSVHTLRGTLSYYPSSRGAEIARQIESAATSGDLTAAARLLPELEEAIAVLHAALKQKDRTP
jgi:HPt (histidine-containing phosphotransfer) domain-containing protein